MMMLILGYADWCGHCKQFKPTWDEFKNKYQKVIDIREVNADKQQNVMKQLEIKGFPTVLLLKDGQRHEYSGPRTVDGLEKFVKQTLKSRS